MTIPNNPTDVAPGRIGLPKAIEEVKTANAQDNGQDGPGVPSAPGTAAPRKETRGRKSKAQKEAETEAQFDDLAEYAVNLIKQPIDAYATKIDPYLAEIGYPKDVTFAMKPEEEKGTKVALKIVMTKLDPAKLAKWARWVVCGGILLQLTVPRYLMVSDIRAYLKEKEEKETGAVDTTAKKPDDNNK